MSISNVKPVEAGDFILSQTQAAVICGVTVQTMVNWDKQENPPPRNPDASYSARNLGRWLVEFRGVKAKRGPKTDGLVGSRNEAETRLKEAQAIKAERDNKVAEGLLVPAIEVEEGWQEILMRVRGRLLKLPTALAVQLAGEADLVTVQTTLKSAVDEALMELSESDDDGQE